MTASCPLIETKLGYFQGEGVRLPGFRGDAIVGEPTEGGPGTYAELVESTTAGCPGGPVESEERVRPGMPAPVPPNQEAEADDAGRETDDATSGGAFPFPAAATPAVPEISACLTEGLVPDGKTGVDRGAPAQVGDHEFASTEEGSVMPRGWAGCTDLGAPPSARHMAPGGGIDRSAIEPDSSGPQEPPSRIPQSATSLELVLSVQKPSHGTASGQATTAKPPLCPTPGLKPRAPAALEPLVTGGASTEGNLFEPSSSDMCLSQEPRDLAGGPEQTAASGASRPDTDWPLHVEKGPSTQTGSLASLFTQAQSGRWAANTAELSLQSAETKGSGGLASQPWVEDRVQRSPRLEYVQLQVEPSPGQRIDLKVWGRADLIRVSARTADTKLAQDLRLSLPQLREWLEARGFDSVSAHLNSAPAGEPADRQVPGDRTAEDPGDAGHDRGSQNDQQDRERQGGKRLEQWRSAINGEDEPSGTTRRSIP